MKNYNPTKIEKKWQEVWEKQKAYKIDLATAKKPFYCLTMFSYPSGDKLHLGHWYNYGLIDSYARFMKMQGYDVFEPMGFDSFGLPAENYAIKTGIHPSESTEKNMKYMREQLRQIGAMFDWDREVVTSHPKYYHWTQWIFLELFKKGLAYQKKALVNFCPKCQTVLANEQVINGLCERCDSPVSKKELKQWFFKITDYAEDLLAGLHKIDWPEKTKIMQRNWIGKSEGAEVKFQISNIKYQINVFTTRPDTLFGTTYLVLAPEHELVAKITTPKQKTTVEKYIKDAQSKSDIERQITSRPKTGVFTGSYAINPVNNQEIPIWIADYILKDYGTGAIMAVPAHDQRDFEFATKFNLPIIEVIAKAKKLTLKSKIKKPYIGAGYMIRSLIYDGINSIEAGKKIVHDLSQIDLAKPKINYRLRDWSVSRQRYWGCPIPIIYCNNCGTVPVPEKDLPVKLPLDNVDYLPKGESPLATNTQFTNTKCPKCGGPAKRETDTLDTFVDSTWYFLRYLSPEKSDGPFDQNLVDKWLPIDQYIGGPEHATGHLIYSRFVNKVLFGRNYEYAKKLRHQGIITRDGKRMSKSRGNVVLPDEFIKKFGSDTLRMYLMFMGPYFEGGDWNDHGILGIHRFLTKIATAKFGDYDNQLLHYTIKKVGDDLAKLHFNTAISALMEYYNQNNKIIDSRLILLLAPFAPHLSAELWQAQNHQDDILNQPWPKYDANKINLQKITIPVQINGKVRAQIKINTKLNQAEVEKIALQNPQIEKYLASQKIKKIIYIPDRLINFVI